MGLHNILRDLHLIVIIWLLTRLFRFVKKSDAYIPNRIPPAEAASRCRVRYFLSNRYPAILEKVLLARLVHARSRRYLRSVAVCTIDEGIPTAMNYLALILRFKSSTPVISRGGRKREEEGVEGRRQVATCPPFVCRMTGLGCERLKQGAGKIAKD